MLYCKLLNILAHCYNVFIAYSLSYNIFYFQLLKKEDAIMAIAEDKYFFSQWIASFAVKLGSYDERNLLKWLKIK